MRKKILTTVSVVLMFLLMSICVSASEPVSGTYQEVMSTSISKFFIKAQPSDAIPLDTTLVLDSTDCGKYEDGVYFNLPRLQNQYYYKLEGESAWYIDTHSPYPSLSLKKGATSVVNTKIVLQVRSSISDSPVASCELTILDQLKGTDRFVWPSYTSIQEGINSSDFKAIATPSRYLNAYNPALHESAIVTQGAVYVFDSGFNDWVNQAVTYDASTGTVSLLDAGAIDTNAWIINNAVHTVEYKSYGVTAGNADLKVKPYCMSSEGGVFSTDSEYWDASANLLKHGASASDSYILASDSEIVFHQYNPDLTEDEENYDISVQQGYSYTYFDLTGGHLAQIPTDDFQFYPNTCKYTAKTGNSGQIQLYAPGLTTLNIVASMNGTGGTAPVNPPPADPTTYTLRFDYNSGLPSAFVDVTPGVDPKLASPTKSGFTFKGWYVDKDLTKEYDYKTFSYVLGGSYTLYSKFEAIGNYSVRYYDDKNNTDRTATYRIGQLPDLPANPTFTGYQFKQWVLVDSVSAMSGTRYDPATFNPTNGDSYIFKALWDVQGVILSVTPLQTEYWTGESVDKTKLSVLVQVDSNGTTKNLAVSEFSVNPATIDRVGTNTITVKYDATGATATVELTGKSDYITGISAAYKGEDLYVGDVIPNGSITCKLTYKSGKVVETSEFSISPSTCKAAGTNTITVTSGGYSTSITVNGKKRTNENEAALNNGKGKLSSITAVYTGNQLSVGDNIEPSDIRVTARFADGSESIVSSTAFNYSPSFVRNAGTNTIVVTYQDKTCNLNIVGQEKSSLTNGTTSTKPTTTSATTSGINANGYDSTPNKGNVTGTMGSGGYAVNDPKEKGTSVGYLSGKNILDSLGRGTSESVVNEVDILREISEASSKAESIDITLINTAEGNILTPDMIKALKDRGLTLNITMVSPTDKSTRVAFWRVNGNSVDDTEDVLDLNIAFDLVNKKAETMYHITIDNFEYSSGITLNVTMRDAYVSGTFVNMYKCNASLGESVFVRNMLWSASSEVSIPLGEAYHFVITDYVEKYEDGSDLSKEPEAPPVEEIAKAPTEDAEDEEFNWDDPLPSPTPGKKTSNSIPILPVILVVAGIAILAGIGAGITIFLKAKHENNWGDDDTEDDIPDYEGDDLEYEEEDEGGYYDDEEDE